MTLRQLLHLSDEELDSLLEVLDFGGLDEPFDSNNTEFTVDDCHYVCDIKISKVAPEDTAKTVLEFKFRLMNGPRLDRKDFSSDAQYKIGLKKSETGIVGVKHPLKALRNALSILVRYLKTKKPDYVTFIADEENRQRLYKKFYERYGFHIPEYEICETNPIDGTELGPEEFWLKRTK